MIDKNVSDPVLIISGKNLHEGVIGIVASRIKDKFNKPVIIISIDENGGSYVMTFIYEKSNNVTVEKGSICVNGISLTVCNSQENSFSVAIIPYTWENTNLKKIKIGDTVNLEFDIVGKYIAKLLTK